MLARAAAKAVNGRGAPAAFRVASSITPGQRLHTASTSSGIRINIQQAACRSSQPLSSLRLLPIQVLPVRHASNRRGGGPTNQPGSPVESRNAPHYSSSQPEVEAALKAARSNQRDTSQRQSTSSKQNAEAADPNVSTQQPEFESVAADVEAASSRSQRNSRVDEEPPEVTRSKVSQDTQGQNADQVWAPKGQEGESPVGSLPDLRHGIPSTFEAEFSDKSMSFKEKDAEEPDLNLTEDPAAGGGRSGQDEGPREAYVSSIERRRMLFARYAYISFAAFAITGAVFLGQNWDEAEADQHPEAPNGWGPMLMYQRIRERLGRQLGYYTEPAFPRLLPEMEPQYRMPYTLVLSLEDLLVHSQWTRARGWELAKRPGVDYFLRYLSQYYELVIFTSVQSMNADPVIRKLDPYRVVSWPLFREATRYKNGEHIKDLSYLNRPLSKTLIIDTVPAHVQNQPENAIILPKWSGSTSDPHAKDLIALIPFLEYIATMSTDDVRKVLASYEGANIATEFAAREARAREAFNTRMAEEKKSHRGGGGSGGGLLGGLTGALGFKPSHGLMQVPGEPSPAEGFAQGKMLSDQIRERGQRHYAMIDKDIREHGDKMLEEMAREEKKAQDEAMKSIQSGVVGFPQRMMSGWFSGGEGDGEKKE